MRSLRDCLTRLTVAELESAAIMLGLDVRSLRPKAALADAVESALPHSMRALLTGLSSDGLEALEKHSHRAVIPAAQIDSALADALERLRLFGMAWRGHAGWEVRPTLWEAIHALTAQDRKAIRLMTLADDFMTGLLNLFGILDVQAVESALAAFLFHEMEPHLALWLERIFHANGDLFSGKQGRLYLCSPELDDPQALLNALRGSERALPHAQFTGRDILAACTELPGEPAIYRPAQDWLLRRGLTAENCHNALWNAVYTFQNGSQEAVAILLDEASATEESLTPLEARMFDTMLRQIPQWRLRGHSAEGYEKILSGQQIIPQGQKARRDDPCPCGSGRKYKNCCGRFQ